MIRGRVTAQGEPNVEFEIAAFDGTFQNCVATLDTGFDGEVCLPADVISRLALLHLGQREGTLADGSTVFVEAYAGTVFWFGDERDVVVLNSGGASLAGTGLLSGCRVTIDMVADGPVIITLLR